MITREECIEALKGFMEREKRPPTISEWNRRGLRPSAPTIRKHCGTWGAATKEAGVQWMGFKGDETKVVIDRVEHGESLTQISADIGVSISTLSDRITRYCRKAGIPRPIMRAGSLSILDREAQQMNDPSREF